MASINMQATLVSILQRLRQIEESQSRSNATICKLRLDIDDSHSRIQELEFSHESSLRETNSLLQRFGEQMAVSRRKEQEKLRAAFARVREEMEEERSTCRVLKLQNRKLMMELEEANIVAADTGEELERERKARELMEEVCNELAREIGEDKAEVEQLKQEQAKSREMVERELKMMRMAALWRVKGEGREMMERELTSGDGALQADMDSEEEKIFAPINSHACYSNTVSSAASNGESRECEEQSLCHIDQGELQIKRSNYMLKGFSKKAIRKKGADDDYPVVAVMQARKPLKPHYEDDNDDDHDTLERVISGKNSLETDRDLHHASPKESDGSKDQWNACGRRGPSAPTPCDVREPCTQKHTLPCTCIVKKMHQRQVSVHLDGNYEEDRTGHSDDHLPSHLKVHSLSEDETDYESAIGQRQLYLALSSRACVCKTQQDEENMYTYTCGVQEGVRDVDDGYHHTHGQGYGVEEVVRNFDDGYHQTHGQRYGNEEPRVENEEQRDDGFYGEPVKGGTTVPPTMSVLGRQCDVRYVVSNANDHDAHAVNVEERSYGFCDDTVASSGHMNGMGTHCDAMPPGHGVSTLSTSYGGNMPAKSSSKETPAQPSRIKSSRSSSPIKQCFRPPPASPSHDDAIPSTPNFNREQRNSTSYNIKMGPLSTLGHRQKDIDARTMEAPPTFVDGTKSNSLRAELLKARELDVEHVVCHRHPQISTPPLKSGYTNSFKFSPLRRSLTHSHSR